MAVYFRPRNQPSVQLNFTARATPSPLMNSLTVEEKRKFELFNALFETSRKTRFIDAETGLAFLYPYSWGKTQLSTETLIKGNRIFAIERFLFADFPSNPVYIFVTRLQIDVENPEGPCSVIGVSERPISETEEICRFSPEMQSLQSATEGTYTSERILLTIGGIKVRAIWGNGNNLRMPGSTPPGANAYIFYYKNYRYEFLAQYAIPKQPNGPTQLRTVDARSVEYRLSNRVSDWREWLNAPENAIQRQAFDLVEQIVTSIEDGEQPEKLD